MTSVCSVILAAGLSTRMKSKTSKVLHDICGRPLISYPVETASKICKDRIIVVRAPHQNDLAEYLKKKGIEEAVQQRPLGTGDAIRAVEKNLKGFSCTVLVLCGDLPLLREETLLDFVRSFESKSCPVAVLTMVPDDAASYGRVLRGADQSVLSIVEAKDASAEELKVKEVNTGILCFRSDWLFKSLKRLTNDNAKGEYYITDLVGLALSDGEAVYGFRGDPADDFMGINTRADLARAAALMRRRINERHMLAGVGIIDPQNAFIDADVKIGMDTTIGPNAILLGQSRIGEDCTIENGVVIANSVISDGVHIKSYSVIERSVVMKNAIVGPFARIRPESKVGKGARVGNFVELKKCEIGEGAKANHLAYLGDAVVGAHSNIGCGTITCNYDGFSKFRTVIGAGVFVGSDVQFIAPVKIGRGAVIGAGSTIVSDVPADAIALSRSEQKILKGAAPKRAESKANANANAKQKSGKKINKPAKAKKSSAKSKSGGAKSKRSK